MMINSRRKSSFMKKNQKQAVKKPAKKSTKKKTSPNHSFGERALIAHKRLRGKIEIVPKAKVRNKADLSIYYTPGVGAVSTFVAKNPEKTREYTMKGNTVAVVSDGSAVLGLGNIGP